MLTASGLATEFAKHGDDAAASLGSMSQEASHVKRLDRAEVAVAPRDFWTNVRAGASFVAPQATADSPRLDSAAIENILKREVIWLTPKTVEGFDPKEFEFLSPAERASLTDAVDRFRDIARKVPPNKPATDEQIQQALPQFHRIVEILRPDKYADPDAFVIGKRVEQRLADHFPPSICELRFGTGEDTSGVPALWIWVVLKNEAAAKDVFSSNVRAVRELLEATVRELGTDRWPYVRFRTDAELQPPTKKAKG